jgi:hypothetical protein
VFSDEEESHRSREAMGTLKQGRMMATEYFFHIEQLAQVAGINLEESGLIILQIERGIQPALIDRIYQSPNLPCRYDEYKK